MRYARQIALKEVGPEGQEKLRSAKVLVVGAGGLGCPALQYLAAAGVGTIGIVDDDTVEESNLHRQTLFTYKDIGQKKVIVAQKVMKALNPDVEVKAYPQNLDPANALEVLDGYQVVIDGSDNFPTRYLVNDACVKLDKPFVYGAIDRFQGQVAVFNWKGGPTYRCLFPEPPTADQIPNCADAGVLGVLPGVVGTLQATEALKLILEIGQPLSGKLKVLDLLDNTEQLLSFARNVMQVTKARNIALVNSYTNDVCTTVQSVRAEELAEWLETGKDMALLDVRELHESPKLSENKVLQIPLGELPERWRELPQNGTIVVFCQHGIRSLRAIELLQGQISASLVNLKGGMAAFAKVTPQRALGT